MTIHPHPGRVRVIFNGEVVADTHDALALQESRYPTVFYIPRQDARVALFEPSQHVTHCPYKGAASYFSLRVGQRLSENAVWSYEQPFPAVSEIAGRLAFYPDRVDRIETAA